jgi:diaminohydroxyphosphoribosylaminopyrimidine deaminase/5-amino-6-(5-phosphoribosylamino)uracil reductase
LHRGFLSVCDRGRPFVSLKLASTLDGRIATASGESRWITGPDSRAVVQRLRAATDAIVVGSETAIADDPELVARRGERVVHRPVRVVVDSGLRVSPESRLFRGEAGRTWVLCAPGAASRRRRALEAKGARVFDIQPRSGSGSGARRPSLDLGRALTTLAQAGLSEILVEGGGRLAAALLDEGLVDELHWFTAPRLIGDEGRPAIGPLAVDALADSVALENVRVRRTGDDVHVWGDLAPRARRACRGAAR